VMCVRGCRDVFVKRFVIRTQSRVRSVIGVSQRGGVVVVCVEVSGKKVEGVVLAAIRSEPASRICWGFCGIPRVSSVGNNFTQQREASSKRWQARGSRGRGWEITNLTSLAIVEWHHSLSSCGFTFSSSTNASIFQFEAYQ
jgi:hypothetical protein